MGIAEAGVEPPRNCVLLAGDDVREVLDDFEDEHAADLVSVLLRHVYLPFA